MIEQSWEVNRRGVPDGKREAAGWTVKEMEMGQTVAETDTGVPREEEGSREGILNARRAG